MTGLTKYCHLLPEAALPNIAEMSPFRAVVIVEATVSLEWQSSVSDWLVRSGCLYMMAWGIDCGSWHDSVDIANLEQFDFGEIPEGRFVMTTWHTEESLQEVFWFSKNSAVHSTVAIERTVLLHISLHSREYELMQAYTDA